MDRLLEIFFLPPMAVARCCSSPKPADSFRWAERSMLHDAPGTVIEPSVSLDVLSNGSVKPRLHDKVVFREGEDGPIRPVAPFFELWARIARPAGKVDEVPLTSKLLAELGAPLSTLWYEINAANRKVQRRTGNACDSFVAREVINGADHRRRELKAFSPHTSGQEPLVDEARPIPVGFLQALRPVRRKVEVADGNEKVVVDRDILRLRFTPPKGLVYGPPSATSGAAQEVPPGVYEAPATQWGRIHEIVPPARRILNGKSEWTRYIMMNGSHEDPSPQDGYDGATVGNHQAWGCVDDSTDALIQATVVVDGRLYRASARVFVGPPDFAPDRRPFYSIADDLADRENALIDVKESDFEEMTAEITDLFHRAFDLASMFNLDAERARALQENRVRFRGHEPDPEGPDLPKARDESMTDLDVPYVDKLPVLAPQDPSRFTDASPNGPLPYTEPVGFIHGPLKNSAVLLDFLQRREDLVRKIVRPSYGSVSEMCAQPAADPDPARRDPRVFRDQLHDMRMPPYMRDANLQPLSLSRRQYRALMDFVSLLPSGDRKRLPPQGKPGDIPRRIFARNLTARAAEAARHVVGNPVTTRLESAVGNCFPGLEFDVRELDRRFFPGLVFQFVQPPRPEYELPGATAHQEGAHLLYADWFFDPMLPETSPEKWVQDLIFALKTSPGGAFMGGRWYLDWIEQGGKRLSMSDPAGHYYDGYKVWRMVRCLELGKPLTIGLVNRDAALTDPNRTKQFTGYRRKYVNEAGVIDEAFRPGELTESMCNPWSHDFRDCACHYWATNHPDIVIRRSGGEALPNGRPVDTTASSVYVNWNRLRGPGSDVPAFDTIAKNRPYELDHYQINKLWETLPFVLEGCEIGAEYRPPSMQEQQPYKTDAELISVLRDQLGPMELSLAMQYLYALFSLRDPGEVDEIQSARWPCLRDDLKAVRQFLFLVAVGEMTHLRWVNQMLWLLDPGSYKPVVDWTDEIVALKTLRPAEKSVQLLPLTPERLDDFIFVERPTGKLDSAYARCVSTLKGRAALKGAFDLAVRIDGDGIEHFERFSNIKRILSAYAGSGVDYPYLRPIKCVDNPQTKSAVDLFDEIRRSIAAAYAEEARPTPDLRAVQLRIDAARTKMLQFRDMAEELARTGFGIPLLNGKRPLLP